MKKIDFMLFQVGTEDDIKIMIQLVENQNEIIDWIETHQEKHRYFTDDTDINKRPPWSKE